MQLIHEEQVKAQELLAATPNQSKKMSRELLANPRIFLRKWVGEVCNIDHECECFHVCVCDFYLHPNHIFI